MFGYLNSWILKCHWARLSRSRLRKIFWKYTMLLMQRTQWNQIPTYMGNGLCGINGKILLNVMQIRSSFSYKRATCTSNSQKAASPPAALDLGPCPTDCAWLSPAHHSWSARFSPAMGSYACQNPARLLSSWVLHCSSHWSLGKGNSDWGLNVCSSVHMC